MNAAENVIQANPDVKVFICVNDTVALGVVEAYKAANISDIAVFSDPYYIKHPCYLTLYLRI